MNKLEIQNFKAFGDAVPIKLDNDGTKNILLYGENGAGKSSIFEAFRYIFYKDRIEAVDTMLPKPEQMANIEEIRNQYRNKKANQFDIKINNQDAANFSVARYQVFLLDRFDRMDKIQLSSILKHQYLPYSDLNKFMDENWQLIMDEVNIQLSSFFHEQYEILVGDKTTGYDITIKNKQTGLSRNKELSKFFNEAIINLIQLLLWFTSIQLMFDTTKKQLIILDDFITSLDAANRTYFVRYVLNNFAELPNKQIIILTHDFSFYNITSYIISEIEHKNLEWNFFKLYLFGDQHRLEKVARIKIKDLRKELNNATCSLNDLGNRVRKCFEEELHELSSQLTVGNLEETKDIIKRISESKEVYWKPKSSLHDLISDIDRLIPSISDNNIKNELRDKIDSYKITNVSVLRDTINRLKLYQKVSMHPLSHGVLGIPHFQQKEVEQSLILLEQLDKCVHSIIDGKM